MGDVGCARNEVDQMFALARACVPGRAGGASRVEVKKTAQVLLVFRNCIGYRDI